MALENQILDAFGENLRKLRTERGMTQSDLEAASGIDRANISHIENGNKSLELITVLKLIKALGLSPERVITADLVNLLEERE